MSDCETIPVRVLLARELIEQPWRDVRWRAREIVIDEALRGYGAGEVGGARSGQFLSAPVGLVLDRQQETDYRVNLANGEPTVYVLLAESEDDRQLAHVRLVTVSPFAAEPSAHLEAATVQRVTMPSELFMRVRTFLDAIPRRDTGAPGISGQSTGQWPAGLAAAGE